MKASQGLIKAIAVTAEIMNKDFSEDAARLLAEELAEYPEPAVLVALSKCRRELKYFPTLSEIIERINDGRPGPQEAWAMIPKDESASVVWTDEMAEAFGVARSLLPDEIAARMAFLESYKTLVSNARNEKRDVWWTPSFGTDKSGREAAVIVAVQKGRLHADRGEFLLGDTTKGSLEYLKPYLNMKTIEDGGQSKQIEDKSSS